MPLLPDVWPLRRAEFGSRARAWQLLIGEELPLLGLAFVDSAMTMIAQRRAGAVIPLANLSLFSRLENESVCYVA